MLRKFLPGFALIALLIGSIAFVRPVRADDATPVIEQVTETSTDVPTTIPTEVLTETPTQVPADVPTMASTATRTSDTVTSSTAIDAAPTSTATAIPTSTAMPRAIRWSQPDPVTCTISTGSSTLDYGDSTVYRCTTSIKTVVTGDLPDDLATIWILQANYSGGSVAIRLPDDSTAHLLPPDDIPAGIDARARVRTPFDQQSITFEVVVSRTSCTTGVAPIQLTASPQFAHADGVAVTRTDKTARTPSTLTTTSAPNGEPTLQFQGPITFEPLSATSTGLKSDISHGAAVIEIDGTWNPCSSWRLSFTGTVDSVGIAPQLQVISIDDEPISGGVCDLSSPCDVLTLPASGDAATPLVYTVQLVLVFDPHTPPGSFNVTVSADLGNASGQP